MSPAPRNSGWWDRALGYEIYVRSFHDSDGDGVGDLPGITAKLEYLAWLGIDIVWLSPFFVSPQADFGYDVADYLDVDPVYGTMADVDELIAEAHRLGMRVLGDLVPNHTSDRHRWFRDARNGVSPYRDYYHWRDPGPDGGPPNNWVSHFGGSAWTLDPDSGQYYLHLFLPEQPDLNWANPRVSEEFDGILRFWFERGLDGFRIDVAHGLAKHPDYPDNPQIRPIDDTMGPRGVFTSFEHRYDLDQAATKDVYRGWRRIADEHGALLVGEVYLRGLDPGPVAAYVNGGDGLHRAFYFRPVHTPWDPASMWATFADAVDAAADGLAWALGSHDDSRAVTRFGGGDLGRRRSLAFATFLTCLPGLPFLYQGDELALADVDVPVDRLADPVGTRNANPADSRDKVRTPLPWGPGPHLGFSQGEPWLPMGDRSEQETVAAQRTSPDSWLARTRAMIDARAAIDPGHDELVWVTPRGHDVLAFTRGPLLCALNVGTDEVTIAMPDGAWQLRFSSVHGRPAVHPAATSAPAATVTLGAPEAALFARADIDEE